MEDIIDWESLPPILDPEVLDRAATVDRETEEKFWETLSFRVPEPVFFILKIPEKDK